MNDISFERIEDYIHAYKVKGLHDFLSEFREEFNRLSNENLKKNNKNVFNFHVNNPNFKGPFINLLSSIVDEYYYVDKNWDLMTPMLYFQTDKINNCVYHNHYLTSSITATTYLDPPSLEEGGSLELYLHQNDVVKVFPKKDYIYFFPSWILHRPLPQTRKEPRFCINWGYQCLKRPIHKLTADKW